MKHTCPQCGHKWDEPLAHQQAGGKARWKRVRKKARSAAAREMALKRWADVRAARPAATG